MTPKSIVDKGVKRWADVHPVRPGIRPGVEDLPADLAARFRIVVAFYLKMIPRDVTLVYALACDLHGLYMSPEGLIEAETFRVLDVCGGGSTGLATVKRKMN